LKKKNFSIFWVFLKIGFWVREKSFLPFLQNGWTGQGENFFMSSSAKLGCLFFFLRNLVSEKLGSLYKILTSEKKGYWQWLQYFASPDVCKRYFPKKRHPDWVLLTTKKFQLDTIKSRFLQGEGKLLLVFGP
jgi:hypothetical protein